MSGSLAIVTPSYAPDYELCRDLGRSVLEWSSPDVHHHVVVPGRDLDLFRSLRSARTEIWTHEQLLPRRFCPVPGTNLRINMRRPYPPLRGWVTQQMVKLLAAAEIEADVTLLVDSDVVFVRPFSVDTFREDGRVRFYRKPEAVHAELPRHVIWHDAARRLLGLPQADPPLADYVSTPNAWDRTVILALRDRIERVTGRPWMDAIGSHLHFSECILYGVYADSVPEASAGLSPTSEMRCHNYYETKALTPATAASFLDTIASDDVAVMISAKSGTPLDVRRGALADMPDTIRNAPAPGLST